MKRILLAFAALACCVLFASCDKNVTDRDVLYSMGFESVVIDPDKLVEECMKVEDAFISAIQTDLGVTVSKSNSATFSYSGNQSKVKAACEKAALSLQQIPLTGKFRYLVTSGSSTIYAWEN